MDVWVYGCLWVFLNMPVVQLADEVINPQSLDVLGRHNYMLY